MSLKTAKKDEPTIQDPNVFTKYKVSGDIAARVLHEVVAKCVNGAHVVELCQTGDLLIVEETNKVYKKGSIEGEDGKVQPIAKGVAFPTCISVNNCICHFSPLLGDPSVALKDGDVVKIDLGVHVDGYAAVAAHTLVVGASSQVTGRAADVILAAHYCSEAAHRLLRPGKNSAEIAAAIQKIAEAYKCKPVEGMMSHNLTKGHLDGPKGIIQNPNEDQRKGHKEFDVEVNDVFGVDVVISTGEGKARQTDTRTTVYKKTASTYQLKLQTSRKVYGELSFKYTTMPFTLRGFENESRARMGIVECTSHGLVEPYHVLYEQEGELVAQIKFTALVAEHCTHRTTPSLFDAMAFLSEHSLEDEELKALLAQPVDSQKQKKPASKKKNKKKAGAAGSSTVTDADEAGNKE